MLLMLAILLGVMSLIGGVYGFTQFSKVTGRIASVLFLILLIAFIIVVLVQI